MVPEKVFNPTQKTNSTQTNPNKPTQLVKISTTNQAQTWGSPGSTQSVISLALRGEIHVKKASSFFVRLQWINWFFHF